MTRLLATALLAAGLALPAAAQDYSDFDRNRDGVISRDEWRGRNVDFRDRDWNRDGILSGDEITGERSTRYSDQRNRDYDDRTSGTNSRARSNDRGAAAVDRLDKNRTGVVEGYEWPYNADVFHRLDTNADSVLQPDELRNMSGATMRDLDTNRNGRIDDNEWPGGFAQFERLDQNNDGRVSSNEYYERGSEWQRRTRFDQWDTNRDSHLTRAEWKASNQLFRQLDTNNDGVLDWNEYSASTERYDRPYGWRQ